MDCSNCSPLVRTPVVYPFPARESALVRRLRSQTIVNDKHSVACLWRWGRTRRAGDLGLKVRQLTVARSAGLTPRSSELIMADNPANWSARSRCRPGAGRTILRSQDNGGTSVHIRSAA
jgi:hypothetical protein